MSNKLAWAATLLWFGSCFALAAGSGGGGGGFADTVPTTSPKTPEEIAARAYKSGLRHKAKAVRLESKAERAKTDKKRQSFEDKARKRYDKAIAAYAAVLKVQPRHYEAANEMGYALRKNGDFQKAIGAYNYALQIKPDFLEAIEYRGEALLMLGYLDETKKAYMRLFRDDPALAAQLMEAIQKWLTTQQEDAGEDVEAFSRWVEERARLVSFSPQPGAQPGW